MPITLNCPKCHKPFRVRDESIGGRVRCPSCGSVLQVPAALSPASNFGEPGKAELPIGENTQRPVAEDVGGSAYGGTAHEAIPATRSANLPTAPGNAGLPGPPSIKVQGARAPALQLDRSAPPVNLPLAPSRDRSRPASTLPMSGDAAAWSKVRGGLGMIRLALFLCALVVLAFFGHGIWVMFDQDRAIGTKPGLLGKDGWPLWREVMVAYTAGLLIPAALLLLFGRLRCSGAPSESQGRGLALSAAFFTFIALAGLGMFIGMTFFELGDKLKLPEPERIRLTSIYAAIPSALLADVLTLLFIGQIGWPVGRPGLQKSVASYFAYALLLPAGVLIGMLYYPVIGAIREAYEQTGVPLGDPEGDTAQRATIWSVILLTAVVMLFLRYAGIAGSARRGINKMLGT